MLRTHSCGEVNEKLSGKNVTLTGWVDSLRIMSKMIFVDLRDRYGLVQCIIKKDHKDFKLAKKLTKESCIRIKGKVKKRLKINTDQSSGKIAVEITDLKILSLSDKLPFDPKNVTEDIRLKYRYLDLRINPKLRKNIELRHNLIKFIRNYLDKENFLEIQTPLLTKSSPAPPNVLVNPYCQPNDNKLACPICLT